MSGKHSAKTDAMLAHLATGGDAQDFAGTKFENLALARSLHSRGLIAWDGEGNRFVLTPAGWSALTPRRFGLPSLAASGAIGAVGVAALAFIWLPSPQWQGSAHGHATTTPAAQSIRAEIRGPIAAPLPASAPQPAPAARTAAPESTMPPVQPLELAEAAQPAPEQPSAEATSAKQAAVKKQPRRTARPEQHNGLSNFFASFGRSREAAQTRPPREVTQTRARQTSQTRSGPSSWFRI